MNIKLVSTILLLLISFQVAARQNDSAREIAFKPEWNMFMEVAVQSGGDGTEPLPLYNRADGQFYSGIPIRVVGPWAGIDNQTWEDEAKAGGFLKFAAGVEIPLFDQFSLSTAFGYQFDDIEGDLTDGSNGSGFVSMSRRTIDFIGFYNYGRHRFGLGGTYHYQPQIVHKESSAGFSLTSRYNFDDAIGAVLQYDYLVTQNLSFGLRLTEIAYDFSDLSVRYNVGNVSIDANCTGNCKELVSANSFGAHVTYRF
ncbi:hypothetical protein [Aliikangiella coralliicola]|uniref:MipA/OmpV family protein n=1 Tax=Aliikangiella coralliicola TaxID=2592383 RepID=A0A545U4V2_9GAMM|nr:hypothetical protein [Aliikangiella coralliicola]TQV84498.1 hypothetical protein FLL46_23070 [Aliikangiella coralliicola]